MKNDDGTNLKNGETDANKGMSESTRIRFAEKMAKKEGVSKGAWITAIICFILLVAGGIIGMSMYKGEQKKQLAVVENQKQAFTEMVTKRDSMINESMATFDQIEKNLASIKEKENLITMKSSVKEYTKESKLQILQDIADINGLLDQNKKKIASLTAQLKNSGGAIKGLQVKIAELETSMKQSESDISNLKLALADKEFKIDQLNTRVNDQMLAITKKDSTINNQTFEMNKAFVATGTYKDLKTKGLVTKEGGFLGLGRKEQLHSNFADNTFTQVNTTELKSISINAKSAKLITDHPAGSYELVLGKDKKVASLDIKDPEKFWKISKYAVVEIKN